MPKRRMSLHVRIPPYTTPRIAWRKAIHAAAIEKIDGQVYRPTDRLEIKLTLYLNECALGWHDVDNRLKDVMDALQGRAGGSKAVRTLAAIIPNDHQIYRVTVEKMLPPGQSHGRGHLRIRNLSSK